MVCDVQLKLSRQAMLQISQRDLMVLIVRPTLLALHKGSMIY